MQDKIKAVAARIREMRDLKDIQAEQMAEKLSIDNQTYLDFEEGNSDIPASVLYEIAAILEMDLGLLLTGTEPRMRRYSVTRKGKGASVERRKAYQYQNLASNFIQARAEPFLVTVEPNESDTPPEQQAHPGQEFEYILEGRLAIYINDQTIILEEGDSIYFDSTCPHAMRALDNARACFLAVIL